MNSAFHSRHLQLLATPKSTTHHTQLLPPNSTEMKLFPHTPLSNLGLGIDFVFFRGRRGGAVGGGWAIPTFGTDHFLRGVIVVLLSTPLVIVICLLLDCSALPLIFDIFDCLSFDKRVVRSCGVGVRCVAAWLWVVVGLRRQRAEQLGHYLFDYLGTLP